jgi:hypothetical protein
MSHSVPTEKTNIPSSSALWAVIIFVGLIIAAINFVQAENKGEEHGEHGAATEHVEGVANHEAPVSEEHVTTAPATEDHAATDTAHHEAQPAAEEAHH